MADFAGEVRQLMAERGLSLRGLARASGYDPSYLSKILSGRKPASPYLAACLDKALGAEGGIVDAAATSTAPRDAGSEAARMPRRAVTAPDAEAVTEITRAFRDLDNRLGGAHAHGLAAGYLNSSVTLMLRSGSYTEDVGQQLFGAAAQLAHLVAWSAYDIDDHCGRAVRYVSDLRRRLRRLYGSDPKVREFDEQASQVLGSH